MKTFFLFSRISVTMLFCFAMAMPSLPAVGAAAQKAKAQAPAKAAKSPEELQKQLEAFAADTIGKLNRHALPSLNKKEIKQNADGSFTARYVAIDPATIKTSYKKTDKPGPVPYIGYMSYNEAEYHCTAATKADAEKGPFTVKKAKMLTELIKYANGKWTY
ncbi:MAG: hypothetical protein LBD42_04735 [Desulfovibrio sp.]|nr:hypothetical protein [Desulfovibrio sp.]